MLSALAMHAGFDLRLEASGDLHVDQHHLVEDCGIVVGQAVAEALGDRRGIERTGFFAFPMEDAIALAAIDLSRPPRSDVAGPVPARARGRSWTPISSPSSSEASPAVSAPTFMS